MTAQSPLDPDKSGTVILSKRLARKDKEFEEPIPPEASNENDQQLLQVDKTDTNANLTLSQNENKLDKSMSQLSNRRRTENDKSADNNSKIQTPRKLRASEIDND